MKRHLMKLKIKKIHKLLLKMKLSNKKQNPKNNSQQKKRIVNTIKKIRKNKKNIIVANK